MTGQAYINNKDISTFGALLIKGAYNALLKAGPIKEVVKNSSRLQHGTRVIATSVNTKVDERTLNLTFWVIGSSEVDFIAKYTSLIEDIQSGMLEFKVPGLHLIFKLLYSECVDFTQYNLKKAKVTIKFLEPNPKDRTAI